jgi:hypothetical protein
MKKIILGVFAMIFPLSCAVASLPASASFLDLNNQEGFVKKEIPNEFGQPGGATDIRLVVIRVIQVLLSLLAIIFLGLMLFAGFKYMTAQGDSGQVEEAKDIMTRAAIGFVIMMAAWSITTFILNTAYKQIFK